MANPFRRLRSYLGLSLFEMARMTNMSRQRWHQIETDANPPSLALLWEIWQKHEDTFDALGVDLQDLIEHIAEHR